MRWGHRIVALFAAIVVSGTTLACGDDGSTDTAGSGGEGAQDTERASEGQSCTREKLQQVAEGYIDALANSADPEQVSLSSDLRMTENGQEIDPGDGFWQTAGQRRLQRNVLDTESCGVHSHAVMDEDGANVIVGVRLQLDRSAQEITEIEQYVTREDDYWFWDPERLIASDDEELADLRWEDPVPEEQRSTRAELIDLADGYFESFGRPDDPRVPMENGCYRSENGLISSNGDCTLGLDPEPPEGLDPLSPEIVTHRRYPVVDVEAGIVVAYVVFGDALDFHMFKVVDGEIRLIGALVTAGGHDSSGWD